MEVRIWRNGLEHKIRFQHGERDEALHVIGPSSEDRGTLVTFKPSKQTFTKVDFDISILERRVRELAFLNSGMLIILRDERHAEPKELRFHYDGGLSAFAEWLDSSKLPSSRRPLRARSTIPKAASASSSR